MRLVAVVLLLVAGAAFLSYSYNASSFSPLRSSLEPTRHWKLAESGAEVPHESVAEHLLLHQLALAFLLEPLPLSSEPRTEIPPTGDKQAPPGMVEGLAVEDGISVVLPSLGPPPKVSDDDEEQGRVAAAAAGDSGVAADADAADAVADAVADADAADTWKPDSDADADADAGAGADAGGLEVEASGEVVAIEYVGSRGDLGAGGRYLTLCEGDWICASGWHANRKESRFELLRVAPHGNATGGLLRNLSGAAAVSGGGWFALRSVANGRLLQMAPPSDAQSWVVRLRAQPRTGSRVSVGPLELWRKGAHHLRNRGTGALLNFRGVAAGDGFSVRGHADDADSPTRLPCTRFSAHTRFQLRRAPLESGAGEAGGGTGGAPTCIALGVSTRSRYGSVSAGQLPLFSVLLPSFLETVDATDESRFRFVVYVGHDDDDPWWALPARRAEAEALFASMSARAPGLNLSMAVSSHSSMRGNPCAVWSALFAAACAAGCDYFYQLNDDLRLVTRGWASELVATLSANAYVPNLGIAGPLDTNNRRLMTQSFAHCTHLRVFGFFYPPAFRNWYSDDWATQVYGGSNTFWRRDIEVHHQLAHLGPRYTVAYADVAQLATQVELGRQAIARWVAREHPEAPEFVRTQLRPRRDAVVVPPD